MARLTGSPNRSIGRFLPVSAAKYRCTLLILGLAIAGTLGSDVASAELGSPVSAIVIRADTDLEDLVQLVEFLSIEVGDPYSLEAVSDSIRNLQASGSTGQIEAFARTTPEGVEVTFALWANYMVNSVELDGDLGIKRRDLMSEVEVRPRSALIESQILRDFYRLGDRLAVEGFLAARVTPDVEIDEQRKLADVTYRIESGPSFTVAGVDFEGDLGPFDPGTLMQPLRSSPGKRFFSRRPAEDAESLEGWLIDQGYRQAIVDPGQVTTDWEAAEVHVRYRLELGPHFEIEVLGGDSRRLQKKGLLPFLEQQRFDEALLLQSVERIRSFYQQQGYYQVEIETSQERTGDSIRVRLVIEPGLIFRLAEVLLTGNEYFSDRQLTPLMTTSPRRGLGSSSGRLVDSVLADDLANIEAFYALNGYDQAVVGPPELEIEGQDLYVGVPIEEGRQLRVVELKLEGVTQLPVEQLVAGLPLSSGGPFHQALLNETIVALRSRYEAEGYESTQISPLVEWSEDGTRVDITLRLLEGPRSIVDRIIVRGANRTNARVVRYAMGLESGEHFNTNRLLKVQRNLYRLGTFSRVEVRRAPGVPFKGERDILVNLEEGKRRKLTYGFGFDSEDGLRGLFGYSMSNLLGRALTARADVRASNRDNLARVLLTQPYFFHLPYPSTVSLFYIEEVKGDFTSRRRGGQFEIQRQGNNSRVNILLDYRKVEVLDADELLTPDRDYQEVEIASVTPAWMLDHRNDEFDPSEGWNTILQVEYAFPFIGAETEFLKAFVQAAGYLDFGRIGVLAGSFRVGAIEPLNEAFVDPLEAFPPDLPSRYIPISERFFAGGRTTHRAYKRDRLGIPGETLIDLSDDPSDGEPDASSLTAVGGNGLLIVNLDYRFPIAGPIGGTLFADFGNLWADWRSINVAEGKPGIGTGVRYSSPIGPIRVEVGYKLDPLPGEDDWVVLFSVGNAF